MKITEIWKSSCYGALICELTHQNIPNGKIHGTHILRKETTDNTNIRTLYTETKLFDNGSLMKIISVSNESLGQYYNIFIISE